MASGEARLPASGGDPARDRPLRAPDPYRNLDLPPGAYSIDGSLPEAFIHLYPEFSRYLPTFMKTDSSVSRPGFNTTGREVNLQLNAYPIDQFPTRTVFQYDVTVSGGMLGDGLQIRRGTMKKVWDCETRKRNLKQIIFDGHKLAWSLNSYEPVSLEIDLDAEYGKREMTDKLHVYRLHVRKSRTVNLEVIDRWLQKKMPFDESILQALNFLDHLMREHPGQRYVAFKRSFFDPNEPPGEIDFTINVFRGFYQAIRPVLPGRLVVNVDMQVCAFWQRISLAGLGRSMLGVVNYHDVADKCKPVPDGFGGHRLTPEADFLSHRLRKLEVFPYYDNCTVKRSFIVERIVMGNATHVTMRWKNPATAKEEEITTQEYFMKRYNHRLEWPLLPIIKMTKDDVYYPMELVYIRNLQRYPWKLDDNQTARMLKHASQRPSDRLKSIEKSKARLGHSTDPILQHFGMRIGDKMIHTKGRVLPNPEIQFGNQKHNPGISGRWDLRGKKFFKPNRVPLKSWGCGIIVYRRNTLEMTQAENWCNAFMKQYAGHGGKVETKPLIMVLNNDIAEAITTLYENTGNRFKQRPQLLIFFAPNKDSWPYLRIKKSCDCRYGVASQVLQSQQVVKMNTQYMSNVAMKINAKLGGVTARSIPRHPDAALRPGSMIIGADVSHATPGSWAPSLTAISVSADEYGAKYMGARETGYRRVELIHEQNLATMLAPLRDEWSKAVGKGRRPQYIYYFRDGVSTSQFSQVLDSEVPIIKKTMMEGSGEKTPPKICVVIANKRHHLRAFPDPKDKNAADKNGNPVPGTLVERDITSPHDWDFLLYPHIALQGTSRPVHYHVIRDEIGHKPNQLENMIYDHSYQYVRSTTSVSLFPAVYYAHLIAHRARHHENVASKEGPQSGPYIKLTDHYKKKPQDGTEGDDPVPLLKMAQNETRNDKEMWFV